MRRKPQITAVHAVFYVSIEFMRWLIALFCSLTLWADSGSWQSVNIGRLRYGGGGDWYSNPSSLPNLMAFISKNLKVKMPRREVVVSLSDESFRKVPVLYFTGHGRFTLTENERQNLRWFLRNGGFLFADDNFGMDQFIRKELNNLFAGEKLRTLPLRHKVFRRPFYMPTGLPKIHKHYGGPPVAYGLFLEGRMVAFYGYNTDLGDGWEDVDVHKNSATKQEQALKMGANVIWYALHAGLN